jgi:hypothetical protein
MTTLELAMLNKKTNETLELVMLNKKTNDNPGIGDA